MSTIECVLNCHVSSPEWPSFDIADVAGFDRLLLSQLSQEREELSQNNEQAQNALRHVLHERSLLHSFLLHTHRYVCHSQICHSQVHTHRNCVKFS